ncbi:MAG: hypothetical protein GY716_15825 [bacterium]|nr:hypothetical protein [bacterium]
MRDFQRQRLYDWENRWERESASNGARRTRSLFWHQVLARKVFTDAGWQDGPEVVRNRRVGWASANATTINLCVPSRTSTMILLHEAAHAMLARLRIERLKAGTFKPYASHGPEFCRLYAELLGLHAGEDQLKIERSMRAAGLKVSTEMIHP